MSRTSRHVLLSRTLVAAGAPWALAALTLFHGANVLAADPLPEALPPASEASPVPTQALSARTEALPAAGAPPSSAPTSSAVPREPAPAIAAPSPAPTAPAAQGGLVFRAVAGAGFSDYEDRGSTNGDVHMFANGLAAISAGYAPFRRPEGSLDVALELVVSHSLQGSSGSRAAGNFTAAGLVLSTFLEKVQAEIGLGGYLVRRAEEAQDLALTSNRWNGGVGAFLAKYWPLADGWSWGVSFKVLMLPTRSGVEADGQKHVHFSDGVGILGLSAAWR